MTSPNPENKPLTFAGSKTWWPFILTLVTLVAMWVTMSINVNQIKVDLARVETDLLTRDEKLMQALDKHLEEEKKSEVLDAEQNLQT